jgi:hypothetical protein
MQVDKKPKCCAVDGTFIYLIQYTHTHTGRHLCTILQPITLPANYKIMNQVMNLSKEDVVDTDGPLILDCKLHSNMKYAITFKHFKASDLAQAQKSR